MPAVVSPSRLARFFYHECDRYLRYSSVPEEERAAVGIPPPLTHPTSTRAVVEAGFRWEEDVVGRLLLGRVVTGSDGPQLRDRSLSAEETRAALSTIQPGEYLYQPTLPPSGALEDRLGFRQEVVAFASCRPDLVECFDGLNGRSFRIIDVKSGVSVKLWHRVQTTIYALILESLIAEWDVDDAVVADDAGVWLAGAGEPTLIHLRALRPAVERFLKEKVPRLMSEPPAEADWHVQPRCEWCQFLEHCRREMTTIDDLSRVAYISAHAKQQLRGLTPTVRSVADLANSAFDEPPLREQVDGTALAMALPRLRKQAQALTLRIVEPLGTYSVAMPRGEHVRVVLTVQRDPLSGRTCAYGIAARGLKPVFGANPRPSVEVARTGDTGAVEALEHGFVEELHNLLSAVHDYNETNASDWRTQRTLQVYALDRHEVGAAVELLLRNASDTTPSDIRDKALRLLFYLQGPELLAAPQQPDPKQAAFPLISVIDVARKLLALPLEVSYNLADLSRLLSPPVGGFEYRPSKKFTAPLSSRLHPDPILDLWSGPRGDDAVGALETELRARLWATGSIIDGIRQALAPTGALFAWPPRFALPAPLRFQHPLLSRLAFLTRYESILSYLDVRTARTFPVAEQLRRGTLLRVTSEGENAFKIMTSTQDIAVETSWQPEHVLVPDSPEGIQTLLAFDDYSDRRSRVPNDTARFGFAQVTATHDTHPDQLSPDRLSMSVFTGSKFGDISAGATFLLSRRFTDWTVDPCVRELEALDHEADSPIVELVTNPGGAAQDALVPPEIATDARALAAAVGMTESQMRALEGILARRLHLVWGPPGTGKTHFLALAVLCLIEAHRRHGRRFRTLVSAFTHTAIDNVLRKTIDLQEHHAIVAPTDFAIAKAGMNSGGAAIERVDPSESWTWLQGREWGILGATAWSARQGYPPDRADLIIIDEASQLRLPEAAVVLRRLRRAGRLVVAGDDRQLPPIVLGSYPDPPVGQPPLHRSLFEVLRSQDANSAFTSMLLENFRSNYVLCRYPAEQLYRPDYTSADPVVGTRRISLAPGDADDPLLDEILDPEAALVVGVTDGVRAAAENRIEADLVARLARALRYRLLSSSGDPYAANAEGDAAFWREGLFIVSPHHAQIAAIRDRLSDEPRLASSFVDTVDRMQGQEADVVVSSYGVADAEYALGERDFIYSLNRLNVAITRARAKAIVLLSRSLVDPPLRAYEHDSVADGVAFMQGLVHYAARGVATEHRLPGDATIRLFRLFA